MKLCWRQEWWSSSEAVSAQPWRRHLLDLISCSHNHRVPEHERKHKCERPEQKNFGRVLGAPRREQPSTWARGDGEGEGWLVSRGCWETPHIRQKCLGLEPWPSRLQPAPGPRRRFWAQGGGGIEDDTPQTVMGRLFPRLCHGKKRTRAGFQKRWRPETWTCHSGHFTLVETRCHPVTAIQPRPGGSQISSRALRSFCLAPTAASLCAGLPAGESVNLTGLHRSGPGERSERVCAHGWLCAQPPDSSWRSPVQAVCRNPTLQAEQMDFPAPGMLKQMAKKNVKATENWPLTSASLSCAYLDNLTVSGFLHGHL